MSEEKNKELEDLLAKLKKYEEVLDDESDFDDSSMNELIEQTLSQLSDTIALKKDSENTKYTLKYVNVSDNKDPNFANEGDSGFDLRANIEEDIVLDPLKRVLIPTGLFFQLDKGYEIQVRPRSGLAVKNGITVLNSPGTVDSHYRGECKVPLINLGEEPYLIQKGDRIAQAVVCPVFGEGYIDMQKVDAVDLTSRGSGGFGSTGTS